MRYVYGLLAFAFMASGFVHLNPLFILVGIGFWILAGKAQVEHEAQEVRKPVYVPAPCPRCSNNNVAIFPKGGWDYFACGYCGARGWYPFNTEDERIRAYH